VHIVNPYGNVASFRVDDDAPSDTTPFIIDQNGNVGIGIGPSATQKLRVSGPVQISGNLTMSDNAPEACAWTGWSGGPPGGGGDARLCPTGKFVSGIHCDRDEPGDADRCRILCCGL